MNPIHACLRSFGPGLLLTSSVLLAQGGGGLPAPLGVASDFDIFGLTGVRLHAGSVYGRLAGNKFVDLTRFAMALDPALSATDDTLVSGGQLFASFGVVSNGNAAAEDQLVIQPTVMFRNSSQDPRKANLYDFELIRTHLKWQSAALGFLPPNGDADLQFGVLFLTGSDPVRNVFTVTQADLQGARRLSISIPPGSVALVNVEGGVWSKSYWGVEVLGVDSSSVLINSFEASEISMGNVNMEASILAPNAILAIDQMHVAGNVIARAILMTSAHTTGTHLAPGPWETIAGFAPDESGHDTPDYSLIWPAAGSNQNIMISLVQPNLLEVIVESTHAGFIRRDRLSRLVIDGPADYAHLHIDPAIGLPVELSGAAPVAMDDRVALTDGATSIEIDVLANDLPSPFGFGSGPVQIVSGPDYGTAQVDFATGVMSYSLPLAQGALHEAGPRVAQIWYVARDVAGNKSTPRRVWISLQSQRGLTVR